MNNIRLRLLYYELNISDFAFIFQLRDVTSIRNYCIEYSRNSVLSRISFESTIQHALHDRDMFIILRTGTSPAGRSFSWISPIMPHATLIPAIKSERENDRLSDHAGRSVAMKRVSRLLVFAATLAACSADCRPGLNGRQDWYRCEDLTNLQVSTSHAIFLPPPRRGCLASPA